jgi:hypothetical protein
LKRIEAGGRGTPCQHRALCREEALEGVDTAGGSILLNGFKRYRCAAKLRIRMAPYASLGEDEAAAIVTLLRVSNDRSLTILEQARFIEELRKRNAMSVADIAGRLLRSKSWVSMRLGLMGEMSEVVREKFANMISLPKNPGRWRRGGIRTRFALVDSASYRFHIAI